ncbi:MAG TPA: NTP transferase domain-containing protein [Rhizomicrobium sp.]|nr:NTP transferase domain-containing protein [Rhizomicrobium sp.]
MRICAVIPAAGRGTRLGLDKPKILSPITAQETLWSILHAKLAPVAEHIHLILSPEGAAVFPPLPGDVSVSIQSMPLGMGDAIFRGYEVWSRYDAILVVWGDQVFVSSDTLRRAVAALKQSGRHAVLPVTRMPDPYVEYVFEDQRLIKVLQSREGDATGANGFSDVGTFLLATAGLKAAWDEFLSDASKGKTTGEINFLPFLPFLSARGWTVTPLEVADPTEARGINTEADLAFFRSLYKDRP